MKAQTWCVVDQLLVSSADIFLENVAWAQRSFPCFGGRFPRGRQSRCALHAPELRMPPQQSSSPTNSPPVPVQDPRVRAVPPEFTLPPLSPFAQHREQLSSASESQHVAGDLPITTRRRSEGTALRPCWSLFHPARCAMGHAGS